MFPIEPSERPHLGDIVILGPGASPKHGRRAAVITGVSEAHCTAVVLDKARRFGICECWPCFHDMTIESSAWRIGSRVEVHGMRGDGQGLNGLVGTIAAHPSQGHPTFVAKPRAREQARLTLCVRFDDKTRPVLLAPRHLVPCDEPPVRSLQPELPDPAPRRGSSRTPSPCPARTPLESTQASPLSPAPGHEPSPQGEVIGAPKATTRSMRRRRKKLQAKREEKLRVQEAPSQVPAPTWCPRRSQAARPPAREELATARARDAAAILRIGLTFWSLLAEPRTHGDA